jgi:hypothetical protein
MSEDAGSYLQARLAVASLIIAWHYILRLPNHDKAAERIERALESAVRLRHTVRMAERPKRPRDPAQLAKLMIDIASGEVEDRVSTKKRKAKARQRPAISSRDRKTAK